MQPAATKKKAAAAAGGAARGAEAALAAAPTSCGGGPLVLVINLARRRDRLRKLRAVLQGKLRNFDRLEAVDGRDLSWEEPLVQSALTARALDDARWAEKKQVPTICRKTGSFSPHLTISAVGCALSHREAWRRLAASTQHDWCASPSKREKLLRPSLVLSLTFHGLP